MQAPLGAQTQNVLDSADQYILVNDSKNQWEWLIPIISFIMKVVQGLRGDREETACRAYLSQQEK